MVKLRTLFEVISTAKSEAEAQTLFDEANKGCSGLIQQDTFLREY